MESANKMKNQIDDSFQIMAQFSHGVRPFAGVIIGKKKVILGKSARLNIFLSYFFTVFGALTC